MSPQSSAIVQRLWNYCTVLREDRLSYGHYVEQLTHLLFLKIAEERKSIGQVSTIPEDLSWAGLVRPDGDELETHDRHILIELGTGKGLIPTIFRKAQNCIQDPAKQLWIPPAAPAVSYSPLTITSPTISNWTATNGKIFARMRCTAKRSSTIQHGVRH